MSSFRKKIHGGWQEEEDTSSLGVGETSDNPSPDELNKGQKVCPFVEGLSQHLCDKCQMNSHCIVVHGPYVTRMVFNRFHNQSEWSKTASTSREPVLLIGWHYIGPEDSMYLSCGSQDGVLGQNLPPYRQFMGVR